MYITCCFFTYCYLYVLFFFFLMIRRPPRSTLFPYTTLFRSGISTERKRQLLAVGGNLMSFDLIARLVREPNAAVMHTHTLGRLGGIALTSARLRRIPLVVTIHGGFLDLPEPMKNNFRNAHNGGLEWGKLFGALLRSRRLLKDADAVVTCN